MQETWVLSLSQEDPLEKKMAAHFSILAWEIPWEEEPGRLQSMGSQRVGHNWATNTFIWTKGKVHTHGGGCQGKDGLATRDSWKHHKLEEERKNFPLEASKDSTGPTKTWFHTSSLWVLGAKKEFLFVWSYLVLGTLYSSPRTLTQYLPQ